MNRFFSRRAPLALCTLLALLSGCAVYDSSLLSNKDAALADGGSAGLAGFDEPGGGLVDVPAGGRLGSAGGSGDAGAAGDPSDSSGASGAEPSGGTGATAGRSQGGSAQGGSTQGGSAHGGSGQGGSAQGSSGQGGSAQAGGAQAGAPAAGATGSDVPHDLSTGKSATASTQQTGNEVDKGNDGNFSTRWCGKDDSLPQWWRVDLGATHQLSSFSVAFQVASRAYTYDIETSTDDKVYTRRSTITGTGAVQTGDFPAGVSARYVRITVTKTENLASGATVWASFYEFSVLGI